MITVDPAEIAKRRRRLTKITLAVVAAALFGSGWGMWTFLDDLPNLHGQRHLILPMFLVFELSAIACAYGGRINRLQYGHMGLQGWLVWVFATASGFMSASDADGAESVYRFLLPMVAATMFELLIRGERRDLTQRESALARIRRRTLARFGLLDDVDQDDEKAATSRMAAKLADHAHRANTTTSDRSRRRHERTYRRLLRRASVRMDFANNPDLIREVRVNLDFLYRSITATSPDAVAGLNVWQATTAPARAVARPVAAVAETPRHVRISPVRRPKRAGWLAGHRKVSKPAATPMAAPPAPVQAPAPVPAAAMATPPPVTTQQIPASKPPASGKKTRGRSNNTRPRGSEEKAFQYWQQNRHTSGRELARRFGLSTATANRRIGEWKDRVPA